MPGAGEPTEAAKSYDLPPRANPFYNSTMHIGIDSRLPTYQMGGISQYTLQLIPALAGIDSENRYTIFHSRKEARSFLPPAGSQFRRRSLWTPCHHRLERWALAAELVPSRLDVLHSPDFIPPAAGARRRIITVHDLNFIFYPQFLTAESRRYYAGQIKWAAQEADHISVDSHATGRDLIEQLKVAPEKITTIHLAANPVYARAYPDEAVAETLRQWNLPRGFILFVGTLEPRKNLPTLLHAYDRLVKQQKLDLPLILVGGKGWIYDEIFATIESLGLTGRVRHLQGVGDEQLAHLYHAAGLLALPSHYEGFGLPVLEAMHCRCPVVVSNRGSLPEVAGDAGLMLSPDDADAWAGAMWQVLTDSQIADGMRRRGLAHAGRFTWRKTAEATLRLYQGQATKAVESNG